MLSDILPPSTGVGCLPYRSRQPFATPLRGPGAHDTLSILSKNTCGMADAVPAPAAPVLHPRVFISEAQRQGALAAALTSAAVSAATQRGAQPPRPPGGLGRAPGAGPPAHLLQVCYTPFLLEPVHVYRTLPARSWYPGMLPGMQHQVTYVPSSSGAHDGSGVPLVHLLQVCQRGCLWCAHVRLCSGCLLPTARMFVHASKVCMSLYARLLQMWGAACCADAGCDGHGGTTAAVSQCSPVGRSGTVPCPSPLCTAQEVSQQCSRSRLELRAWCVLQSADTSHVS